MNEIKERDQLRRFMAVVNISCTKLLNGGYFLKKINLLIIMLFMFNFVFAKESVKILFAPESIRFPVYEDTNNFVSENYMDINWTVWSDRNNNQSYEDPDINSKKQEKYAFMEEFFVIEATPKFLRLAKAEMINDVSRIVEDYLIGDWTDCGWIPKSNLLLSYHCLVKNKQNLMPKKVIIMNSSNTIKKESVKYSDFAKFRKGPSANAEEIGEASLFEFYHIFKQIEIDEKKLYLIAPYEIIDIFSENKTIGMGWIGEEKLIYWDTKVAVEKNWDPQAVEEFDENEQRLLFWRTDSKGYKRIESFTVDGVVKEEEVLFEEILRLPAIRPSGTFQRYPLINEMSMVLASGEEMKFAKVGVIGDIIIDGKAMSHATYAELKEQVNEAVKVRNDINILFVIDATNSMQPYFTEVKKSIENFLSEFPFSENNLDIAVAIYRDLSEGKERAFQIKNFSNTRREVLEFLSSIQCNKTDKNTTDSEDMFYGLDQALQSASPKGLNKRSNFVVLIGDTGNYTKKIDSEYDLKIDSIVKNLVSYDYHFFAFQIHKGKSKEYQNFETQIIEIGNKYGKALENKFGTLFKHQKEFSFVIEKKGNNKYSFPKSLPGYFILQSLDKNTTMVPEEFNLTISTHLRQFRKSVDALISETLTKGQNIKSGTFRNLELFSMLTAKGFSIEQIQDYASENKSQFYSESYTLLEKPGMNYPLYRKVILLSSDELSTLIAYFRKLQINQNRKALEALLLEFVDDLGIPNINFQDYTAAQILNMIMGIPISKTSILHKYKLSEISKIKNDEFSKLSKDLKKKYYQLNNLYKSQGISIVDGKKFNCTFNVSNVSELFFWIEEELLP